MLIREIDIEKGSIDHLIIRLKTNEIQPIDTPFYRTLFGSIRSRMTIRLHKSWRVIDSSTISTQLSYSGNEIDVSIISNDDLPILPHFHRSPTWGKRRTSLGGQLGQEIKDQFHLCSLPRFRPFHPLHYFCCIDEPWISEWTRDWTKECEWMWCRHYAINGCIRREEALTFIPVDNTPSSSEMAAYRYLPCTVAPRANDRLETEWLIKERTRKRRN